MTVLAKPYTFAPGETIDSSQVNANFDAIIAFVNAGVSQTDGSSGFTGIPLLPSIDPTSDNQATRKAYVDRVGSGGTPHLWQVGVSNGGAGPWQTFFDSGSFTTPNFDYTLEVMVLGIHGFSSASGQTAITIDSPAGVGMNYAVTSGGQTWAVYDLTAGKWSALVMYGKKQLAAGASAEFALRYGVLTSTNYYMNGVARATIINGHV